MSSSPKNGSDQQELGLTSIKSSFRNKNLTCSAWDVCFNLYAGPEGILIESAETPGLFLKYLPENDSLVLSKQEPQAAEEDPIALTTSDDTTDLKEQQRSWTLTQADY